MDRVASEPLRSARILVVDDEPEMVEMIRAALLADGYRQVTTTTRAAEALERYRTDPPDLLILDMNMPGVHGMDVLQELHELVSEDVYLPILVVTGVRSVDVKLKALYWGAKDFLPKPFEIPELLLRVRLLLETRALFARLSGPRG